MAEAEARGVQVQVANARPEDVGKGVARLSRAVMQTIGVREGDALEIAGQRHTAALVLSPAPEDEGLEIIRLDGLERANAGVSAGERVEVRRAQARPAGRVTIAPAQKNLRLSGSGEALRRTLIGRPVTAGDVISTSVYQRPVAHGDGIPEEVLRQFLQQQSYALQEIRLTVVSTTPRGIVRIEPDTEIELLPRIHRTQGNPARRRHL